MSNGARVVTRRSHIVRYGVLAALASLLGAGLVPAAGTAASGAAPAAAAATPGPRPAYQCIFNINTEAFTGADGTASAIGWVGDHNSVITCLGGTFFVQDGLRRAASSRTASASTTGSPPPGRTPTATSRRR